MIAFLLALFLVTHQAAGYYLGAINSCAGETINFSLAFIDTSGQGFCYKDFLLEYEDGIVFADADTELLLETNEDFYYYYAESLTTGRVWPELGDETFQVTCGTDLPVNMAKSKSEDTITQEDLALLGVDLDQDLLLVIFCGPTDSRRTLQEDEDELYESKKEFALLHLHKFFPNCENKESCKKELKDLHRTRRFLKAMQN